MGLLSKAESIAGSAGGDNKTGGDASHSQRASRKIKISKKNLSVLKNKITEYQKVYQVFGCILLENHAHEKGKVDFCEKLTKATGNMGTTSPINHSHALVLLPSEMDRELIAHRLSKSLKAETVLSFRAISPEDVINRINSMS
ncbi:MAG: hypothetical protein LBQ94_07070 [Treponema sp.]|jgi:hypothetical protein|nr:hypothetical protein [Treponema sp.]